MLVHIQGISPCLMHVMIPNLRKHYRYGVFSDQKGRLLLKACVGFLDSPYSCGKTYHNGEAMEDLGQYGIPWESVCALPDRIH